MKDFDKGEKWQDLDITTWPIVEHFQERVQTDGYVEHRSTLYFVFLDPNIIACTDCELSFDKKIVYLIAN